MLARHMPIALQSTAEVTTNVHSQNMDLGVIIAGFTTMKQLCARTHIGITAVIVRIRRSLRYSFIRIAGMRISVLSTNSWLRYMRDDSRLTMILSDSRADIFESLHNHWF